MPRKARVDAPGAVHHIIVRGIEQRSIFWDARDRNDFLDRLGRILKDTQTPCYAWALLPNHLHLLFKTGSVPLATIMRRLLTGYAVKFNRRHRRHGKLFQNRYKSILCQEDPYFLELVRYIHLNPLRAKLISDLSQLDRFPYCGHSVLIGKHSNDWQDVEYVLQLFHTNISSARHHYRQFVEHGINEGRRDDLTGGGLVRSMGGWSAVKALRRSGERIKGDERILGDSDFVEAVLASSDEGLEQRYSYQAKGYNFDWLVKRVAQLLEMNVNHVLRQGRYPSTVKARSLLCYWGARELGMTTVSLARKLGIAQPTVSESVKRGERIAEELGLSMVEEIGKKTDAQDFK